MSDEFTVQEFVIWYTDRQETGRNLDDWSNMSDDGVVAVYEFFGRPEDGIPRAMSWVGSDWYWMLSDGTRLGSNDESTMVVDEWTEHHAPPGAILKRGRWVSQERMDEVNAQLLEFILHGP